MIQPAPRPARVPGRSARRKLAVEIYFLLYLSAIVLLLGTSPGRHGTGDDQETADAAIAALLTPDFRLSAERIQLLYTEPSSSQSASTPVQPLRRDTVNGITAHGRFSRIEFRIISIDDSAEGGGQPGLTSLVPDGSNHARFVWQPTKVARPTSWRVRIEGIAQPLVPPSNLNPALRTHALEAIERHGPVRDTVEFVLTALPSSTDAKIIAATIARADSAQNASASGAPGTPGTGAQPIPGQSFALTLNSSEVRKQPGSEWRNTLNIFGIDAHQVNVTAPGARIIGRSANSIELAGTVPSSGSQTIVVDASAPGGSSATARFDVIAASLDDPSIPGEMIVDQVYALNMGAPGLESEITVEVIENGQRERGSHPSKFRYIPRTPGRVIFERKRRGETIGRYEATITPLPRPSIIAQQRSGNTMVITTQSYGTVGGRPNLAQLKVDQGEVEDPVEIGSAQIDQTSLRIVQQWRVTLKSPQLSRQQQFDVWVMDQRGSASRTDATISVPTSQ